MKNQKEKKRKKWRETLAAGDEEGIYRGSRNSYWKDLKRRKIKLRTEARSHETSSIK